MLGGGVAGVGYFGYQFYQDRFGAAPDFAGDGNGEQVTVTIPKGAGGSTIGQELKRQGVVKSVDAFIAAQQSNPRGKSIQDGVYTLQKEMSADSAIELLLNPKSRSNLIIAEGKRNADVYKLIDKRLDVKDGTTAKVAKSEYKSLGLPDWALNHKDVKDPLEGFLYPSSYSAAKGQKPEDVLKQMVARANEQYEKIGLEEKAEGLGLKGPWELLTVASLLQAEGKTHDDFRKMSEVIYNRLKTSNTETNQKLQFDSTFNYLMRQSKIHISESEINTNPDPYNTYYHRGLPPDPSATPAEGPAGGAQPDRGRLDLLRGHRRRGEDRVRQDPRRVPEAEGQVRCQLRRLTGAGPPYSAPRSPTPSPGPAPRRLRGAGPRELDVRPLRRRRGGAAGLLRGPGADGRGCR
ncbi:Endolytic murein transglycosylase [Streptomyces violaceorubidus]